MDADCIIVGGGIGGTVLALALARNGRQSLILEREAAPPAAAVARPEILAGATIDLLNRLGVGERVAREAAIKIQGLELFEAGGRTRIFGVSAEELARAGARPHSTDPGATRRILLEEAERTGKVRVERGIEVQGPLHEGGRVVGVAARKGRQDVAYRAPLTVGDDGTKSRLRAALGIGIRLTEFPFDFFGTVIPRLAEEPPAVGHAWMNPRGFRQGFFAGIFLPVPGDRTALVFAATPKAAAAVREGGAAAFAAEIARLSPLCADPARLPTFPDGYGYFRRPFGHAARYAGDGVALIGDAAHPVTPAGGQGANMSISDAAVLADVAAEALAAGDCSAQRLARYEAIRRPANARSLEFSARPTRVFRVLETLPWMAPLLLVGLVRSTDRNPVRKERLLGAVSRTFTSSDGGRT
jgi:2-polyprenyl-6-methoxyphenol hydroxylase-like FAD-dependent oxidoreductase